MSDPASLQNLHDIVVPPPVPWWPPAPGWYAVAAVGFAALAVLAYQSWKRWRRNRYRGEALRELRKLRAATARADLRQVPVLLKRAALSAWPRSEVAALVGEDWHRFLDESAQMDCFAAGVGDTLDRLAYVQGSASWPSQEKMAAALDAAERWLKRHRAPVAGR